MNANPSKPVHHLEDTLHSVYLSLSASDTADSNDTGECPQGNIFS